MSLRRFQCAATGERCSRSHALSAWVIESWQNVSSRASRAPSKTSKYCRRSLARSTSFLPSATSPAKETVNPNRFCRSRTLALRTSPIPVHINAGHSKPRQPLSNSGIKLWLVERLKQDFCRVPPPSRPKIGEPRITERAQFHAEIALLQRNSHSHFLRSQRQRRRRKIQHFETGRQRAKIWR